MPFISNEDICRKLQRYATLLNFEKKSLTLAKACTEAIEIIKANDTPLKERIAQTSFDAVFPKASKSLTKALQTLAETGELEEISTLEAKYPPFMLELYEIPGFGCTMAERLYQEYGIQNWQQLAEAYLDQKLTAIPAFGTRRLNGTKAELLRRGFIEAIDCFEENTETEQDNVKKKRKSKSSQDKKQLHDANMAFSAPHCEEASEPLDSPTVELAPAEAQTDVAPDDEITCLQPDNPTPFLSQAELTASNPDDVLEALSNLTPKPEEAALTDFTNPDAPAADPLHKNILRCPNCMSPLLQKEQHATCPKCNAVYPVMNNIIILNNGTTEWPDIKNEILRNGWKLLSKNLSKWMHPRTFDATFVSCCAFHELSENLSAHFLQYGAHCDETTSRVAEQLRERSLGDLCIAASQFPEQTTDIPNTIKVQIPPHKLPFANEAFDRILVDPVYHPENFDTDMIHQWLRCLKPNGLLIITAPVMPPKLPKLAMLQNNLLRLLMPAEDNAMQETLEQMGLSLEKRNYCKFLQILSLRKR